MRLRLLAVVVVAVLVEGLARVGLMAVGARGLVYAPISDSLSTAHQDALQRVLAGTTHYIDCHLDLGWALRPSGAEPPLYRTNAQGFPAEREYSLEPPAGTFRIAAFGAGGGVPGRRAQAPGGL